MSSIDVIIKKVKEYIYYQRSIDALALLLFTLSTILISVSVALFFLKSPLYGIIGIVPLLFYRPVPFIERTRTIEKKNGLHGELINSIQLSRIPEDNKEKYSGELINAFIDDAVIRIKDTDFRKHLNYRSLHNATRMLLISIAFALIHPAFLPEHFWYSLNHKIYYSVKPGAGAYLKGTDMDLVLQLNGVYLPTHTDLIVSRDNNIVSNKIAMHDGVAKKNIKLDESLTYQFEFLDHRTDEFTLVKLEPLYIEALSFRFDYPHYTKLKSEVKTGRQLIAPRQTRIQLHGRASQPLKFGQFQMGDTLELECDGKDFSGEFVIKESGTATLYLKSFAELKEQIIIYSIPDLAPLVDIFYPGYNINVPNDMQLDIGIRCSDDYGLEKGTFYYTFEEEFKNVLAVKRGALEDTLYFQWDLSNLGLLPGDEISYFAKIVDNAGNTSTSKTYYIYFPTMEEIYEEVSEKGDLIEKDLGDLQTEHIDEMAEIARIQQKMRKERQLLWADEEKLREVITTEEKILEKIDEWQAELERSIEKLREGIILDQESIERLQEIAKILQEIAPDELKEALENLQLALNKNPQDIQKALENLEKSQQEMAEALERTLAILRRYQQEEKLKELAQMAKDLALEAGELEQLAQEDESLQLDKNIEDLNKGIDALTEELDELADSEDLEQAIKEALEQLAEQGSSLSGKTSASLGEKKQGLNRIAADLEQLYESLTKGRAASLRKNLLEIVNRLIDISKAEEQLYNERRVANVDQQDEIIEATKVVAESLYAQQTKSLYVSPTMGKNLAKAINHMEKAKQVRNPSRDTQEAMKFLNLVSLEMLETLEKAAQGGSSTGMSEFLQNLSNISKGQMSLNQSMLGFFPIPVVGLTAGQKAQLQRLAGKQRALREALESLRNETNAAPYQELLDNIIDEMAKTEEALYQYKVDRQLIERQRMILSRLLDAQKSIRKEDYEKRRKSKPGEDFLVQEGPEALPENLGEDQLRELIQRALRESYPKEYEFYIREYFRNLLEER